MTTKPKLCYFRGRGRMESIRWLLAAGGVEFEEEFIETTEQYEKLQKDGCLLFGQVPMVEIDGMVLTQTRAILSYLAAKYDLYGKDLKETVRINMYADGTLDLMMMTAQAAFKPPEEKEENLTLIVKKAKTRYFPAFEKVGGYHSTLDLTEALSWRARCARVLSREAGSPSETAARAGPARGAGGGAGVFKRPAGTPSYARGELGAGRTRSGKPSAGKILNDHGEDFLVGNKFSWADIQLLEAILMVEELDASVLSDFPLLKAFKARISNIPTIKKFLQPGSPRKPPSDSHYVEVVRGILQF
ncbi:glutathione S-transferase alpha-4-like [Prionailurus bengalensis]|uniref:glutathione S-transferase alpha-4-like n=1 Tax=Prionailurus bengalensis TaxID=37029 RepID=UPI001CA97C69|nr:glutathione S-transferase alpha-4-like [Prionailurus bengalensis]